MKNGNESNLSNFDNSTTELPDCPKCGDYDWCYSDAGQVKCHSCGYIEIKRGKDNDNGD